MGRTTGLLIACCKCSAPREEEAWARWYDDEHLPDLLRGDFGAWVATRWEVVPKPAPGMPGMGTSHVTLYELEGPRPEHAADRLLERDLALRSAGRIHPHHAVIAVQLYRAHGAFTEKPEPSPALQGHILAQVLCAGAWRESEWDAWVDREHVPDMLASGAFAAATRWIREPRVAHGANHLTLYDVHHAKIETAVELSAAAMPALAAAGRKHPGHTGGMVLTLRPSGRYRGTGLRASEVRRPVRS